MQNVKLNNGVEIPILGFGVFQIKDLSECERSSVFDFELNAQELAAIAALDTKTSSFFDHRNPEMVKWLGTRELDV